MKDELQNPWAQGGQDNDYSQSALKRFFVKRKYRWSCHRFCASGCSGLSPRQVGWESDNECIHLHPIDNLDFCSRCHDIFFYS